MAVEVNKALPIKRHFEKWSLSSVPYFFYISPHNHYSLGFKLAHSVSPQSNAAMREPLRKQSFITSQLRGRVGVREGKGV